LHSREVKVLLTESIGEISLRNIGEDMGNAKFCKWEDNSLGWSD
jgi:hypothetical protein